jgi:mRNA-degrading endonuclease RelE of RelBE toxin-antitoxin system
MEIVKRCYQYFDKEETSPIIKPHKEYYKQWSYNEKTISIRVSGFKVILEIIITVLLGIISPTLTAYQHRKEKKTEKKRKTIISMGICINYNSRNSYT